MRASKQSGMMEAEKFIKVQLDSPEEFVLAAAANVVRSGGILVYPTETVYGIGGDARNAGAVRRVIAAKKRTEAKPILTLVHSVQMAQTLAETIPGNAQDLIEAFWPGPLTIIFKALADVPEEITQGTRTVGIRIPSNTFCLELMQRCACPLTSTSANMSGEPVQRTIQEIHRSLNLGVDLYIDAGTLPESKPSTVVSVIDHAPKLIREGVITFEQLQAIVPQIIR